MRSIIMVSSCSWKNKWKIIGHSRYRICVLNILLIKATLWKHFFKQAAALKNISRRTVFIFQLLQILPNATWVLFPCSGVHFPERIEGSSAEDKINIFSVHSYLVSLFYATYKITYPRITLTLIISSQKKAYHLTHPWNFLFSAQRYDYFIF
jgi:hypothetical protein